MRNSCFGSCLCCDLILGFLCNVKGQFDETQVSHEDELDDSVFEDDDQNAIQHSTPKRQFNR